MGQIWDEDAQGPQPELCGPCAGGECGWHSPFFNEVVGGVVYGLFNCECLCEPANVEAAVAR